MPFFIHHLSSDLVKMATENFDALNYALSPIFVSKGVTVSQYLRQWKCSSVRGDRPRHLRGAEQTFTHATVGVLPWSCADRDSWCCWYFTAIASVLSSCLCISYDIIPPYNIPQTTVTSRRHWKILRCLREHTPFPMLDPHPSPPSARENPVSAGGNFRLNFLPPSEDLKHPHRPRLPSLPEHFQAENTRYQVTLADVRTILAQLDPLATLLFHFKVAAQIFAETSRSNFCSELSKRRWTRVWRPPFCVSLSPLHFEFSNALQRHLFGKLNPEVSDRASMAPLTSVTCQPSSCLPANCYSEGSPSPEKKNHKYAWSHPPRSVLSFNWPPKSSVKKLQGMWGWRVWKLVASPSQRACCNPVITS